MNTVQKLKKLTKPLYWYGKTKLLP